MVYQVKNSVGSVLLLYSQSNNMEVAKWKELGIKSKLGSVVSEKFDPNL